MQIQVRFDGVVAVLYQSAVEIILTESVSNSSVTDTHTHRWPGGSLSAMLWQSPGGGEVCQLPDVLPIPRWFGIGSLFETPHSD